LYLTGRQYACGILCCADGKTLIQCSFESNSVDGDNETYVVEVGGSIMLPFADGEDCYDCGPCTESGMTCTQMFRLVKYFPCDTRYRRLYLRL